MPDNEDERRTEEDARELRERLLAKLNAAKKERFVVLLMGRTGVGKSSTVNSLMGQPVAPVDDWVPGTHAVEKYESKAFGIGFEVVDTPGLCDAPPEDGNDDRYIELIRSNVDAIDCMWFVSRLNEARVSADEQRGIRLISEAFGKDIWKHTVIVFTFANSTTMLFQEALDKRREVIRREIAKHTSPRVAREVPAVAVDNKCPTTPDGREWLGELYTRVFTRMSDEGITAFYLATASRIIVDGAPADRPDGSWFDRSPYPPPRHGTRLTEIHLNTTQVTEVKKRIDTSIIGNLALTGATIGSAFGPLGAVTGGVIGAGLGLILWLFD